MRSVEPLTAAPGDLAGVAVPLLAAVLYVAYHYGAAAPALTARLRGRLDPVRAQVAGVVGQRLLGALLLGVVPVAVVALGGLPGGLASLGLARPVPGSGPAHGLALGIGVALLPVLWLASGSPTHRRRYPMIRAPRWGAGLLLLNAASWAVYLLGYEVFFRGFVLWFLVARLGTWPGILVTSCLYVFAHLPKDAGECAACIVMGAVFGALAVATGAVWAPLLLHLVVAVASDGFALLTPAGASAPASTSAS